MYSYRESDNDVVIVGYENKAASHSGFRTDNESINECVMSTSSGSNNI